MSTRTKKERRKQKKQRDQKRQKAMLRAKGRPRPSAISDSQLRVDPAAAPTPSARESTPIENWWEDYLAAAAAEQLRMVRDKLETVYPDDEWYEALFPEAIHELEKGLSEAEYVAFLEELRTTRPGVFSESEDWHARSMAFFYIAEERWQDLDRAMRQFADGMSQVHEAFFSVVSMIRLAGRVDASQRLIDAAISPDTFGDLMPRAVNELIEWAMFSRYQACVQAGVTDEAIDAVYQYSLEIGCKKSRQVRRDQRDVVLRLAGRADAWNRDELLADDGDAGRRVYLLAVDFMRWLCESRGFEPLVADELRRILVSTVDDMECRPTALFRGLRRNEFEPALARKLGFMSLNRAHAPAGIVAMRHFYDFLGEFEFVDPQVCKSARLVCYVLWKKLKRAMKDSWQHYRFLERYLPRSEP